MKVNPIRPRYTKAAAANLPEVMKPATGGEVMSTSARRAVRGDWGERASKDQLRNLGGPARSVRQGSEDATPAGNP